MTWPDDYSLNCPGVDSWLNQNEWNFFENETIQSLVSGTDQCIAPQNLYNSSTSNTSRNCDTLSEASSPEVPSLCDDDANLISPKQESPCTPSPTNTFPTTSRKRGRPRTIKRNEDVPYHESTHVCKSSRTSKRLPHNQVERKYREGLNAELERLRMATIHKWEMQSPTDAGSIVPKASKAAVLAGAVAYIQDMERERDYLRRENELLKSGRVIPRRGYQ